MRKGEREKIARRVRRERKWGKKRIERNGETDEKEEVEEKK